MKKNYFYNILTVALVFIALSGFSQETYKSQIGIKFNNPRMYGIRSNKSLNIIYKKQVAENKFRTFDIGLVLGFNNKSTFTATDIKFGIEKHVSLAKNLDFIHGTVFEYGLHSYSKENYRTTSHTFGVGYLLGLEYKINNRFRFGVSVTPEISTGITNIESGGQSSLHFAGVGYKPNFAIYSTYSFNWQKKKKVKKYKF